MGGRSGSRRIVKAITYRQLMNALETLISTGGRVSGEPVIIDGQPLEYIEDVRNGKVLARGTVQVEYDVSPLRLV